MIDWALLYKQLPNLFNGALRTLLVSAVAVPLGVVFGLVIAMMRLSKRPWLTLPASAYIAVIRGTPMLVQILLFNYGIFPAIQRLINAMGIDLWGLDLGTLPAIYPGIVAISLNIGAYLGETFRGGIQSVDKGQGEAALSLGMSNYQIMRYIILPQALANSLPAICNEFITIVKDSSLLMNIAVPELLYQATRAASRNYDYSTMYFGVAIMYFAMTYILYRLLNLLEKRMRAGYK